MIGSGDRRATTMTPWIPPVRSSWHWTATPEKPLRPSSIGSGTTDSDLADIGVSGSAQGQVLRLARLAGEAGCHGVIASPREVAPLRALLGADALIVTPGVTMPGKSAAEHARPATPRAAITDGASHVVVGRSVTRAQDPLSALRRVHADMSLRRAF
ncbi:orotidine 5'-phosphate decarboxylase / HUMPS family protein [Streptomyces sp. NPDC004822]